MISVVVPVYNIEKFIGRCIDSILAQTYRDYEIIIIDDGSTDESAQICDLYADNYNNIKVIHKKNGGLSSARNEGIRIASGQYICFIDSDDCISKDYLKTLYNLCIKYSCDIAMGEYIDFKNINDLEYKEMQIVNMYNSREAQKLLLGEKYVSATIICNKLFDINIFKDLSFQEGVINEDEAIIYKIYEKAKKIAICDAVLYGYYKREGSITKSKFSNKNLAFLEISKDRVDFFCKKGDVELYHLFLKQYCWTLLVFSKKVKNDLHDRMKSRFLLGEFRKESKKLKDSIYIDEKTKISMCILRYIPNLFSLLQEINRMIK